MEIAGGERVGGTGGQFLYRFPLRSPAAFATMNADHGAAGADQNGRHGVSVRDDVLTVALDVGPRLPAIRVESDDAFLLQRLRDHLWDLQKSPGGFNAALSGAMRGTVVHHVPAAICARCGGTQIAPATLARIQRTHSGAWTTRRGNPSTWSTPTTERPGRGRSPPGRPSAGMGPDGLRRDGATVHRDDLSRYVCGQRSH